LDHTSAGDGKKIFSKIYGSGMTEKADSVIYDIFFND
jgi:hypothetical protein